MDEITNYKESEDTERNLSSNLLIQLKEKLKTQAKQIRSLESYKYLCEERIKDLLPSHPFPVLHEHIGIKSNSSQEILNLKQKISKFEQQLLKNSENLSTANSKNDTNISEQYKTMMEKCFILTKENKELEETLRSEMQSSEEQRSYIEVLKQTIEINMESLGLNRVSVEDFANYSHIKVAYEQSQKELSKALSLIIDKEYQINELQSNYALQEKEFSSLNLKSEKISKEYLQIYQSLQNSEEEIQRLEIEKSRLIEYIEHNTKSEEIFNEQIKNLKFSLENIERQYKLLKQENKTIIEEKKILQEEAEKAGNDSSKLSQSLKESQHFFINLKLRVEEKDRIIQKRNEEVNCFEQRNLQMTQEIEYLEKELTKTKESLCTVEEKLEDSEMNNEDLTEKLLETQQSLQKTKEKAERLESLFNELNINYAELEKKHKILNEKYINLNNRSEELNKELEIQKVLVKDSVQRENSSSIKNSEKSSLIIELTSKSENLFQELTIKTNTLALYKEENEDCKLKIQSITEEKNQLESTIDHLKALLEGERNNLKFSSDEILSLKTRIENLNDVIFISNENYTDRDTKLKEYESENQRIIEQISNLKVEIQKNEYEKMKKSDELCRTVLENERILYEYNHLKECYLLANQQAKVLISLLCPKMSFKEEEEDYTIKNNYLMIILQSSIKEVECLLGKYSDMTETMKSFEQKSEINLKKYEDVNQEYISIRSKELFQRNHIENLTQEINYLRESLNSQVGSLQNEILLLRGNLKSLHDENEIFMEQIRKNVAETNQYKYRLSSNEIAILALEEKFILIKDEKTRMASLIKKIQHLVISPNYQRIINEALRIHSELEFCQLEKLRISMQLRKSDEIIDQDVHDSLKKQALLCESNIRNYSLILLNLENQLNNDRE